jgi:hypothetical protein
MSPSRKKDPSDSRKGSSIKDGKNQRDLGNGAPDTLIVRGKNGTKRSMKLTVKPNWEEIEEVRNSSSEFFRSHGFHGDAVNALTMVISELIENGIKYGNFKASENKVILTIHIGSRAVTVEVVNPVDESAHNHLRRLDRTIQWIRGYQDPFQAYTERIRAVSRKPLHDEESGLGLVRIAYEGKSILDFFVGDDNTLNVSAVSILEQDFRR